jgi:hypothetical protein
MKAFFQNWSYSITEKAARDFCGAIKDDVIRSGLCDPCPEMSEGEAISSRVYWRLLSLSMFGTGSGRVPLRNDKHNKGDH